LRYWWVWPLAGLWGADIAAGMAVFVFGHGWGAAEVWLATVLVYVMGLFLAFPDRFECENCHYRMGWLAYVCHRSVVRAGGGAI
jgi:hypothetical protein